MILHSVDPLVTDATEHMDEGDPLVTDINEHMDDNINHICNLLHHPLQSDKQQDYTYWHHQLGHLSYAQLQELVKQSKLLGNLPPVLHQYAQLVFLPSKQNRKVIMKAVVFTVLGSWLPVDLVILPSQIR
jgi:hypothetical protein